MSASSDVRTLWMGDLESYMDEEFVRNLYGTDVQPHISQIKIIRDRSSGQPAGYGFVEFASNEVAKSVLQNYSGRNIPSLPGKIYRLNWATFGTSGQRAPEQNQGHAVFVGDLASDVTDYLLYQTFAQTYPSTRTAKVVMDQGTGQSRGYGFVRFDSEQDMVRALREMQGQYISSRPIKVSHVTRKGQPGSSSPPSGYSYASFGTSSYAPSYGTQFGGYSSVPEYQPPTAPAVVEPIGTTLQITNLNEENTTEHLLREQFATYGQITQVKLSSNRSIGFVTFIHRESADSAMLNLSGKYFLGNQIRITEAAPGASVAVEAQPAAPAPQNDALLAQQQQYYYMQWMAYYSYQKAQEQQVENQKKLEEEMRKFTKPVNIQQENAKYCSDREEYMFI